MGGTPIDGDKKRVSRFERFMSRYTESSQSSIEKVLDQVIDKELSGLKGNFKEALKHEVKKELLRHPQYSKLLRKFISILEGLNNVNLPGGEKDAQE